MVNISSGSTSKKKKSNTYNWLAAQKRLTAKKKPKKAKSKGGIGGTGLSFNQIYGTKNNKATGGFHSPYPNESRKKRKGSGSSRSASSSSSSSSYGSSGGRSGYSSGSAKSGGSSKSGGGKKKGKGKKGGGWNYTKAANVVQGDINAQLRQILSQAQGQRDAKNYDINKAEALFKRSKGDLDYLFAEAKDYNRAQSDKINQRFATTGEDINALFDTFKAENEASTGSRRDAAMAELQRLGIQQSGLGTFDEDAANAASMADVNNANVSANLAAMQAGAGEVGDLLAGMATGSHASAVGQATNTRNTSIADINQNFNQYRREVFAEAMKANATKNSAALDMFMNLKAAGMTGGVGKKAKKRANAARRRLLKSSNAINRSIGRV